MIFGLASHSRWSCCVSGDLRRRGRRGGGRPRRASVRIAETWWSTVRTETTSRAAISALVNPSPSMARTSACRSVSLAGCSRVLSLGPRGTQVTPSARSPARTSARSPARTIRPPVRHPGHRAAAGPRWWVRPGPTRPAPTPAHTDHQYGATRQRRRPTHPADPDRARVGTRRTPPPRPAAPLYVTQQFPAVADHSWTIRRSSKRGGPVPLGLRIAGQLRPLDTSEPRRSKGWQLRVTVDGSTITNGDTSVLQVGLLNGRTIGGGTPLAPMLRSAQRSVRWPGRATPGCSAPARPGASRHHAGPGPRGGDHRQGCTDTDQTATANWKTGSAAAAGRSSPGSGACLRQRIVEADRILSGTRLRSSAGRGCDPPWDAAAGWAGLPRRPMPGGAHSTPAQDLRRPTSSRTGPRRGGRSDPGHRAGLQRRPAGLVRDFGAGCMGRRQRDGKSSAHRRATMTSRRRGWSSQRRPGQVSSHCRWP